MRFLLYSVFFAQNQHTKSNFGGRKRRGEQKTFKHSSSHTPTENGHNYSLCFKVFLFFTKSKQAKKGGYGAWFGLLVLEHTKFTSHTKKGERRMEKIIGANIYWTASSRGMSWVGWWAKCIPFAADYGVLMCTVEHEKFKNDVFWRLKWWKLSHIFRFRLSVLPIIVSFHFHSEVLLECKKSPESGECCVFLTIFDYQHSRRAQQRQENKEGRTRDH